MAASIVVFDLFYGVRRFLRSIGALPPLESSHCTIEQSIVHLCGHGLEICQLILSDP